MGSLISFTPKDAWVPNYSKQIASGGQAQGIPVAVETLFVGLPHNMQNYGAVPRPLDRWWRNR
jgi:hypothetical protein